MRRGEWVMYSVVVSLGLLIACLAGALASDYCHGTNVGQYLSQRLCQQPTWGYLPLGVDVALLAVILLVLRLRPLSWPYRLAIFALYVVFVITSPVLILNLPFFSQDLAGH